MSARRRVAVTGAPGWLGTTLVRALLKGGRHGAHEGPGVKVRALVKPGQSLGELRRLEGDLEIVPADLRDARTFSGVLEGVDWLVHAAGLIHPQRIADLYTINVDGTRHLLEEAARAGVQRVVHISSNSPVGVSRTPSHVMNEEDEPRPYFHYGRSKLEAEELMRAVHGAGHVETVILRPCWFYGPHQPARQTRFFRMIAGGRPLVFGDGENLRSMSFIDNVVQGILLALATEKAAGRTYWIADERPYTFNEIITVVGDLLEVESLRPRHLPQLTSSLCQMVDRFVQGVGLYQKEIHVAGELSSTIAVSIDAAAEDLGYAPEVALEEGMRRSIEWCREVGQL